MSLESPQIAANSWKEHLEKTRDDVNHWQFITYQGLTGTGISIRKQMQRLGRWE